MISQLCEEGSSQCDSKFPVDGIFLRHAPCSSWPVPNKWWCHPSDVDDDIRQTPWTRCFRSTPVTSVGSVGSRHGFRAPRRTQLTTQGCQVIWTLFDLTRSSWCHSYWAPSPRPSGSEMQKM